MIVFKICGLVIISLFAVLILKQLNIGVSYMPIIACFTVALAMIISGNLQTVVSTVNDLNNKSALNEYIGTMIKALGISYITVVTAEICRSAGEESLAKISEIAGKFEILALSLPMALKLIDIASEIL